MLTILYDGWSLVRQPNSPAALHLLALLLHSPPEARALVALPGLPPPWLSEAALWLPHSASIHIQPTPDSDSARLIWEQRTLSKLVRELDADLLHLISATPSLFSPPVTVVSPAEYGAGQDEKPAGPVARLRDALAQGGMARVRGLLWPADLPAPTPSSPIYTLPPLVHPAFLRQSAPLPGDDSALELPETYILYHGPQSPRALRRLLAAWSWAAGSIGTYYPLLLLSWDSPRREQFSALLEEYQLGETVRVLPPMPPEAAAALYRGCTALFQPAPISIWGEPVRLALASAKPVVAVESLLADALVGPAAYLVPVDAGDPGAARALGAALITVVVEENVSEELSKAARQRATAWRNAGFAQHLLEVYQAVLSAA